MTPAELNLYARACAKRKEDAQQVRQANLYSLAALIRTMVWSKHPPGYADVFPADKPGDREMTDDQMYAIVKGLNALFGGEEVN